MIVKNPMSLSLSLSTLYLYIKKTSLKKNYLDDKKKFPFKNLLQLKVSMRMNKFKIFVFRTKKKKKNKKLSSSPHQYPPQTTQQKKKESKICLLCEI